MAKLVADIVGTGGLGVQLRDDWSWAPLPGQRIDVLMQAILERFLRRQAFLAAYAAMDVRPPTFGGRAES